MLLDIELFCNFFSSAFCFRTSIAFALAAAKAAFCASERWERPDFFVSRASVA